MWRQCWDSLEPTNSIYMIGWLVVLGFNAKVLSWRSVTHMCFLAFSHQYYHNFSCQSHWLLFSHASAEVRGKNTLERKFASTWDRTQNHQVMSLTCPPLSHLGGAAFTWKITNTFASLDIFQEKGAEYIWWFRISRKACYPWCCFFACGLDCCLFLCISWY